MIGNSKFDYIFIRICILGLTWIAPLSILYCLSAIAYYGIHKSIFNIIPLPIQAIAIAESIFYIIVYTPYKLYLKRDAIHPPAPTPEERRELFFLCDENISNPEAYLRKWFLGAPLEEIKRENLKDFLLWAFFNRDGPPGDDNEELEEYVEAMERLLGKPIAEGRGTAQCLRLTLDRVDFAHRSLIWYFCVAVVDFFTYTTLLHHGFHHHRLPHSRFLTLFPLRPQTILTPYITAAPHVTYWHRPHTSKTKLPILFIHGIGIGLYPYTNFLHELNSIEGVESEDGDDQVGIIALEIMPVAFRITSPALSREAMCAEIDSILLHHFSPTQKFVLMSHSYGTVITTHLLKDPQIAPRIGAVVLMDPVSILLHLPDVAYNFTRRKPKEANEHQLYYFASMDMSVSHTLSRHFFWNENVVWKKDFGNRPVTAALSGRDLIVDTEAVGRYLSFGNDEIAEVMRSGGIRKEEIAKGVGNGKLIDIGDEDGHGKGNGEVNMRGGDMNDDEEWKYREWKGTGIDVLWFKECDHAQVFDKKETRKRVIDAVRFYCRGDSEEVGGGGYRDEE